MTSWHHFTPTGARATLADLPDVVPMISGQLLARHATSIGAPVMELTARRAAELVGFLRACRQADALAVVGVEAGIRRRAPGAGQNALRGIAAAAAVALHDRPIVVVARADRGREPAAEGEDLPVGRDIVDGYGAIGVDAAGCADPDVLLRLLHSAEELDLGFELEVADGDDVALLLASIDDRGLPISAVRGASPWDETGRATRVVDIASLGPMRDIGAGGLRVNVDAMTAGITGSNEEVEVRSWLQVSKALRALQAEGTAGRLALALEAGVDR